MPNVETSQTVLLIISSKHFYGLCNHTHPAIAKKTIPNSNKLRTYSKSRYYKDDDIVKIICGGTK